MKLKLDENLPGTAAAPSTRGYDVDTARDEGLTRHPPVRVYDFIDRDLGKVIPYGVYDLARNVGWVNVAVDHDTPEFAVRSIADWWKYIDRIVATSQRRRTAQSPIISIT